MNDPLNPETLKIPAYLRKKTIVSQAKQKLILTALDRKEAGLSHKSQKRLAPVKTTRPKTLSTITPLRKEFLENNLGGIENEGRTRTQNNSFAGLKFYGKTENTQKFFPQKFHKIGTVTHYLEKIGVAIIQLSAKLKEGDYLLIQGDDCFFTQIVEEMQINRQPVKKAKKGDDIGLKVTSFAATGVAIYKA